MPNLTYTEDDFEPFTKILSAAVNSKFADIENRLNWDGSTATTGLNDDNIQSNSVSGGGLTRSSKLKAGTASHVLINDGSGLMSSEATLARSRGGLGASFDTLTSQAGKAIIVNDAETALAFGSPDTGNLTQGLATDIASLTVGESISARDTVCLDIHNGTGSNLYRVFKCDSDLPNRRYNFLGFATAAATVTAGTYTWTDSDALVTSNTIAWSINGRSYTQAFDTDNDTTLAAIATQIGADQDVQSASVVDAGSNDRVINITAKGGLSLNITGATVTGGASQATITIANTQAPSGQAARIRCFGPLTGFTGLTVGANYYLSSTAGSITATPSDTNPIFVGQAISDTVLFVNRNVGSFQFGTPSIFVKAFGSSAGEGLAFVTATSEHFNFTSWSTGAGDSTAVSAMQSGDSQLGGYLVCIDGLNVSSSMQLSTRLYNKASWSSGTPRSTGRGSGGSSVLGSNLNVGNGGNTGLPGTSTAAVDVFNGASWTAGAVTLTNGTAYVTCFTQGGKSRWVGGVTAVSGTPDRHDTYNGTSAGTDTVSGLTSYLGGGSVSASGGITGTQNTLTSTKQWTGSSWSSSITATYASLAVSSVTGYSGPMSGYYTSGAMSYLVNGSSGASTSTTTTAKFNGTAWSADSASATARAGGTGAVF